MIVAEFKDVKVECRSFAEELRQGGKDRELQMSYVPQFVSKQENGARRIDILVEDIKKGAEACYLQLYGYFFKNEERMKAVLESGPWMVNNVPLVLNIWEPGIWLEKVEPSTIPIWVCVHNISMELCNGNGIGKIMSGIGKPMLMEKMTKERCLKKSGKLDFARVPARVAAQATKDSINIKGKGINVTECRVENDDGFVMVELMELFKEDVFKAMDGHGNGFGISWVNDTSVRKPHLACMYNQDSRPRVLVRGSGSNTAMAIGGGSGGWWWEWGDEDEDDIKKASAFLSALRFGNSAHINDGTYLLLAAEDESTETKFLWYELNT
ncbi:hypothetical protein Tco_0412006 [Tanacetum coccineum]